MAHGKLSVSLQVEHQSWQGHNLPTSTQRGATCSVESCQVCCHGNRTPKIQYSQVHIITLWDTFSHRLGLLFVQFLGTTQLHTLVFSHLQLKTRNPRNYSWQMWTCTLYRWPFHQLRQKQLLSVRGSACLCQVSGLPNNITYVIHGVDNAVTSQYLSCKIRKKIPVIHMLALYY